MSIKKEDLIKGQLYGFINKGKMCVGEFTGNFTDDGKAIVKYENTQYEMEVN